MVKRIGGMRRKTRYRFTKERRARGKISVSRYNQIFNDGDRVYLEVEPSVQKGVCFPRFMGRSGVIKSKRGKCYLVSVNDLGKEKTLIVHPVHLKRG